MNPKRHAGIKVALGAALAAVLCLLVVWCVFLVRDKLLSNADRMGTSLATTYAAEEENRFSVYRYFLRLGGSYLDDLLDEGASEQELSAWLNEFADNMTEALGESIIDPYVVVNGTIIAANPWEGDDAYDFAATQWYQNAVNHPGRATYTDAYTDAITDGQIVTLATTLSNEENVVAFDIRLNSLNASRSATTVPGKDGGLVPAFEIMLANTAIRNLIREEKTHQMDSVIAAGGAQGMQTMDQSLFDLVQRGVIDREVALTHGIHQEALEKRLSAAGL